MADAQSAIRDLHQTERYADMTLKCQGKMFRVHRAIVCTRSPVLAAAVDGSFMEATNREIDLSVDEPDLITALVRYLYRGDYIEPATILPGSAVTKPGKAPVKPKSTKAALAKMAESLSRQLVQIKEDITPGSERDLMFHVKMYVIADKYNIPALKELATTNYGFATREKTLWNKAIFPESVNYLWENTMDSDHLLRNTIASIAVEHLEIFLLEGSFLNSMRAHSDLCIRMLRRTVAKATEIKLLATTQEDVSEKVSGPSKKAVPNKTRKK